MIFDFWGAFFAKPTCYFCIPKIRLLKSYANTKSDFLCPSCNIQYKLNKVSQLEPLDTVVDEGPPERPPLSFTSSKETHRQPPKETQLCANCRHNQWIIVQSMANYDIPEHFSTAQSEEACRAYQRILDEKYPLCASCVARCTSHLTKLNRKLNTLSQTHLHAAPQKTWKLLWRLGGGRLAVAVTVAWALGTLHVNLGLWADLAAFCVVLLAGKTQSDGLVAWQRVCSVLAAFVCGFALRIARYNGALSPRSIVFWLIAVSVLRCCLRSDQLARKKMHRPQNCASASTNGTLCTQQTEATIEDVFARLNLTEDDPLARHASFPAKPAPKPPIKTIDDTFDFKLMNSAFANTLKDPFARCKGSVLSQASLPFVEERLSTLHFGDEVASSHKPLPSFPSSPLPPAKWRWLHLLCFWSAFLALTCRAYLQTIFVVAAVWPLHPPHNRPSANFLFGCTFFALMEYVTGIGIEAARFKSCLTEMRLWTCVAINTVIFLFKKNTQNSRK